MKPSEHTGGKPAHDEDYRAGWAAGLRAAKGRAEPSERARKAYRGSVTLAHGSWWRDGYADALRFRAPGRTEVPPRTAISLDLVRSTSVYTGGGAR